MLILVGVSIQIVINSGLFESAKNATTKTDEAYKSEANIGDKITIKGKEYDSIEDYIAGKEAIQEIHNWTRNGDNLTCSHCNTTLTIGQEVEYTAGGTASTSISGAKSGVSQGISDGKLSTNDKIQADGSQTIAKDAETTWVVLGIEDSNKNGTNETLLLTTAKPTEDYCYMYGAAAYNNGVEIIEEVCKKLYGTEARGMTIEDVNNCLGYTPAGGIYRNGNSYQTTGNFTTKLNELPMWETIKAKGTYTPDGANTEEALGNYELNGYYYYLSGDGTYLIDDADSSNTSHTVTTATRDLIFGSSDDYYLYWLASRGVSAYSSYYAFFGPGRVSNGLAGSCLYFFNSNGDSRGLNWSVRAVVSLRSDIPATT